MDVLICSLYFKNEKYLRQGMLLPIDNYWLRGGPNYLVEVNSWL